MERFNTRQFRFRGGALELEGRTLLMGILNITPDSFSDAGKFSKFEDAVARGMEIEREGADILDIGAESTRPGSMPVSSGEQIKRLIPALRALKDRIRIPISIDTRSNEVASACLAEGAHIINDVSGLRDDPAIAGVCAHHSAGLVVMHMRGSPLTMQTDLHYENVQDQVRDALQLSVEAARDAGLAFNQILVDPGLGFGKSSEQNHLLMGSLERFRDLAAGVLIGPSRKAFTGEISGLPAEERQFSTAAAVAICALRGADVIRVHDVQEMRQVVDMCDRFKRVVHA